MIQSRPVLGDGRVLGVAISHAQGWHFVAADPVVADLHGQLFPSPEEATRVASLVLARARALPAALPVLQPPGLTLVV